MRPDLSPALALAVSRAPHSARSRSTVGQLEMRTLLLGTAVIAAQIEAGAARETPTSPLVEALRSSTVRLLVWKHLDRLERWCFACGFTANRFTRSQRAKPTPRCIACIGTGRLVRARRSTATAAQLYRAAAKARRSAAIFSHLAWRTSSLSRRLDGKSNARISAWCGVAFGALPPPLPGNRSSERGGRAGVHPASRGASRVHGPKRALLSLSWHHSAKRAAALARGGMRAHRIETWRVSTLAMERRRGVILRAGNAQQQQRTFNQQPAVDATWGACACASVVIDLGVTQRLRLQYVGIRGLALAAHAPWRCGWKLEGSVNGSFWQTLWGAGGHATNRRIGIGRAYNNAAAEQAATQGRRQGANNSPLHVASTTATKSKSKSKSKPSSPAWRCVDLARQGATWDRERSSVLQSLWQHASVDASERASVDRALGFAAGRNSVGTQHRQRRAGGAADAVAPPPLRFFRLVRCEGGGGRVGEGVAMVGNESRVGERCEAAAPLVGLDLAGELVSWK